MILTGRRRGTINIFQNKKQPMIFREAYTEDITQIQFVRNAVKENTLSPKQIRDPQHIDLYCNEVIFIITV